MEAKICKLLLIMILLQGKLAYCQSRIAYYDANDMASLYKSHGKLNPNDSILTTVLEGYYGPDQDIAALVQQNPFLKTYFKGGSGASLTLSDLKSQPFNKFASSIGSLDVSNFADGLARFLIERSKEELNVAFFRRFQEFMGQYPEVRIVFPTTSDFLQQISSYNYAAMLPALRSAFQKDLSTFCSNTLNVRTLTAKSCTDNNKACEERVSRIVKFLNTKEGRAALGALIVADNMTKGNNAAEVLNNLANDAICQYQQENFSAMVQFTNLLSLSIRSKDTGRIWITQAEVNKLVNNSDAFKIYLGLLYATNANRDQPIVFHVNNTPVKLDALLTRLADNWPTLKGVFSSSFRNLGYAAAEVSDNTRAMTTKKQDEQNSASIVLYASYTSSFSSFLKNAIGFFDELGDLNSNLPSIKKDLTRFTGIIDAATDVAYDIHSHSYTSLALHSSMLIEKLYDTSCSQFIGKYLTYATFMASVAEAQSSDDVKAAIEAAVLPVGSSSIKRETNFNISLNAYIGPFAGAEYMPQLTTGQWKPVVGLTAPVGVAFSWGNICNGKRNKSHGYKAITRENGRQAGGKCFTLFVPLIDVGTIATYRLDDDSTKIASKIELRNIISPGLYAYYGFGKCPISFGIGAQVGPPLREITAATQNISQNVYVRFGVNLVVDIPFFNLYTKN